MSNIGASIASLVQGLPSATHIVEQVQSAVSSALHEAPCPAPVSLPQLPDWVANCATPPAPGCPPGDQFHFAAVIQDVQQVIQDVQQLVQDFGHEIAAPPTGDLAALVDHFVDQLHDIVEAKLEQCDSSVVNNALHQSGAWSDDPQHNWLLT